MKKKIYLITFTFLFSVSCSKDEEIFDYYDQTVIVYMCADNDLEEFAYDNLKAMEKGLSSDNYNLIVFLDSKDSCPKLIKIQKAKENSIASKIVREYPELNTSDPMIMNSVITDIKNAYPSNSYGLILWSHGTAWLPKNSIYKKKTKSFGKDENYEMDITDLSKAIPTGFEYIIFDACLMGSIEVCYELKDKVKYILCSPIEIIAEGFPYEKITPLLFKNSDIPRKLTDIAKTYFAHYNSKEGANQTAGISLIYTPDLKSLANCTKEIITNNPLVLWGYKSHITQKLDTYDNTLIYDFYDFMNNNYSTTLLHNFINDMHKVIIYKANTPYFLKEYPIQEFSGLSCYIPKKDLPEINNYYLTLKWAKDSGFSYLVR